MYELYLFIVDYYTVLFLYDREILRGKRIPKIRVTPIEMENIASQIFCGGGEILSVQNPTHICVPLVKTH